MDLQKDLLAGFQKEPKTSTAGPKRLSMGLQGRADGSALGPADGVPEGGEDIEGWPEETFDGALEGA
jgi:hypothetical protein